MTTTTTADDDKMPNEEEMMEEMTGRSGVDVAGSESVIPETHGGVKKRIVKPGSGWSTPTKGSEVSVHYVGRLTDGTIFDSSRDRGTPFTFKLGEGQVIKGWDLGVARMKKGELSELTCAPEFAYGKSSQGKIPANSTLIFEVELLSWTDEKDISPDHDGGITKRVLKEGEGYETPDPESKVTVRLTSRLPDGKILFSSDSPAEFAIAEEATTQGFDVSVMSMKKGEKSVFTVSPKYSRGEKGLTEPSPVVYEVELVSIDKPKLVYQLSGEELITGAESKRLDGNSLYSQKRFRLAMKRYKKAVEFLEAEYRMSEEEKTRAKPAKVPCYLNHAACLLELKEDQKAALELCGKALAIDPRNVRGLVRRAKILSGKDEWDSAMADLNLALEVDPNHADAKREMALLKRKMQEYDRKQRKGLSGMFGRMAALEQEDEKRAAAARQAEEALREKEKAAAPATPAETAAPAASTPAAPAPEEEKKGQQ